MNDLTEKILKIADESADFIDRVRKESYQQGRAEERKKIFDILKTFTEGDYNSKECKLMVSELAMWEGEQKE